MRSETSAPGRASARLRRSSRDGRSISPTKSCTARDRTRVTGTSRARRSTSRSTTVWPSPRRTSTVLSTAPRTSGASRPTTPAGNAYDTAIRSAPGSDCAASANGREGSGRSALSPVSASRTMAVSITERVSAPNVIQWLPSLSCGARGTRPVWGLSPNRPLHAAGMRIEPAPSAPRAAGTMPAATAAAEPPLDPPGVRSTSHGLRVTPHVIDSVNGHRPSSGIVVLPTTTAPPARSRRTTSASSAARAVIAPFPGWSPRRRGRSRPSRQRGFPAAARPPRPSCARRPGRHRRERGRRTRLRTRSGPHRGC